MSRRTFVRRPSRAPAPAPAAAGHQPLLLAISLAACFMPLTVQAQATGAQAIVGTATLNQQGNQLTVTTTNGAGGFSAINWQSFSVPAGSTTYFAQPNASSLSINRVLGPDPSAIYGTLGSNGRLVLVNPAGITVGAGAVVDTAGFTASTLRLGDADALAGRLRFDGGAGGLLRVDGHIVARSGDIVLIGQDVQAGSAALLQSPQGATILAAGQKVEVTGRGLEGIVFQVQAPTDQAVNLGTLQGDAVGVFAGTLRHSGLVQAQAVSTEGGRVVLKAADKALVDGGIQARGPAGQGGQVDVLGSKVGLLAGASIDTSNTGSGGQIRVGGDYQGRNAALPNAQVTYVDKHATLRANATQAGTGGKVIVWADDTTRMFGSIEAKGGSAGGNGGLVETSGKRYLDVRGARVTAGAPRGAAGTWLLDPDDLHIIAQPPGPTPAPGQSYAGGDPVFSTADNGSPSYVYDSTINAALNGTAGTNVTVQTSGADTGTLASGTGSIYLEGAHLVRNQPGGATLNLSAFNDIVVQGAAPTTFEAVTTDPAAPSALTVNLATGQGGSLAAGPGQVRIAAGSTLAIGAGTAVNAETIVNQGSLTASGASVDVNSLSQTAGASAAFTAGSNLFVRSNVGTSAGTFDFTGNALTLQQVNGGLSLGSNGGAITATGPVFLYSGNGDVTIGRAITTTSDLVVNAGAASTSGAGVIDIRQAVTAGNLALVAWGRDGTGTGIKQSAAITADAALVQAYGSKATLTHTGNSIKRLAASVGSLDLVNKADTLTIGTVNVPTAGISLASLGGAVKITNNAASALPKSGSVTIAPDISVWVDSLSIHAAGDINAQAAIQTFGNYPTNPAGPGTRGSVDLTAAGSVTYSTITTYGGAVGSAGADGGAITISGATGVSGGDLNASGVPSADGLTQRKGGAITVSSANGSVVLGWVDATGSYNGGAGGSASISSGAGSVTVAGVDVSGGDGSSGTGGAGGTIDLRAAGDVRASYGLSANGGYGNVGGAGGRVTLTSTTGGVNVGVTADPSGTVYVDGGIDVSGGGGGVYGGAGAGGTGGSVQVNAAADILLGGVHADGGYGSTSGGNAGTVSVVGGGTILLAGGGSPALAATASSASSSYYGDVISATGGYGSLSAGGSGGGVTITSTGGAVYATGGISAYGGDGGSGAGGAGGTVALSSATDTATGYVDVSGGWSSAAAGGNAGAVSMAAGGVLLPGDIYAMGGAGGTGLTAGGRGGNGGTISLTSNAGDLDLRGVSITAGGGWGGDHTSAAGAGGNGGSITIRANGGGLLTNAQFTDPTTEAYTPGTHIGSEGGSGGWATGTAATDRGGVGGRGGTVQLVAAGNSTLQGELSAGGGEGGAATGGGLSIGGAGGAGGTVGLTLTSATASAWMGGTVSMKGGAGGTAGTSDPVNGWIDDPARFGAAGAAGTFTSQVPGGLLVGSSATPPTLDPTSPETATSLDVVGHWTNTGAVVLAPGAWVRNAGTFTNNGTLQLGGGSLLSVGRYDEALYQFTPGAGTVVNGAAGVIQGTGTLQGNVSNAGTVSPGDAAGAPGTLTIAGNLSLQPGGTLVLDVASNVPAVAGATYDQLAVTGLLTLGGAVQVNAIPDVVLPPPVLGGQLLLATPPEPLVLVNAGTVTPGSDFASASAPAELIPALMLSDAGVLRPLIKVTAPAPTPAPAPAPVPVTGGTLVDRIAGMLDQGVPVGVVQQAVAEENNVVAQFVDLLVKESGKEKDAPKGQPDIVLTDVACKPS